jgi:hypothetical protein
MRYAIDMRFPMPSAHYLVAAVIGMDTFRLISLSEKIQYLPLMNGKQKGLLSAYSSRLYTACTLFF